MVFTQGVNHDEAIAIHDSNRNQAGFPFVWPRIDSRQDASFKDARSKEQIDAAPFDDPLPLGFVPLEFHSRDAKLCLMIMYIKHVHYQVTIPFLT